ncbi:MAG: hypothetical protein GF320_02925, partial [Armatimonadia bacterium]|nr:hypothetical protein [Armatimonadia bacterium]
MVPCKLGLAAVAALILASAALRAQAPAEEARPFIYGCGISWGEWHNLPMDEAKAFDRTSMDMVQAMGGTNVPANFAWIGIETTPGEYDWRYVDHQVEEAHRRGLEIFAYTG